MNTGLQTLAHLDDVGSTSGSVQAWKKLREAGVIRSASCMVPCPWYRAAVEDYHADPAQDLGLHITLNSEWNNYRWRPLTGRVKGLVDAEGFFHHRPEGTLASASPEAVSDEIEARIERAMADGIRPSHLDAHMGTAFLPPFAEKLFDLARKYSIPLPLIEDAGALWNIVNIPGLRQEALRETFEEGRRLGFPVFRKFLIGFVSPGEETESFFGEMLRNAPSGRNWLAIHADAGPEIEIISAPKAFPRLAEYRYFSQKDSGKIFTGNGTEIINWRDIPNPEKP